MNLCLFVRMTDHNSGTDRFASILIGELGRITEIFLANSLV